MLRITIAHRLPISLLTITTWILLPSCFAFLSKITTPTDGLTKCFKQQQIDQKVSSLQSFINNNDYSSLSPFIDNNDYSSLSPFPYMPSQLFVSLAQSQMELLSLKVNRIKSICLYLPKENSETGHLEFTSSIIYPLTNRIFMAGGESKAPFLPKMLNRLPGFENAASLLPDYPMMISSNERPRVGKVEEVMCNPLTKTCALSIPFLQGSHTLGVLLVWSEYADNSNSLLWSNDEKEQITRAAETLSLALSMDTEKNILLKQNEGLQTKLSDALHQIKSPLQALRTYGKLLQQKLADPDIVEEFKGGSPEFLELTKHLIVQSDRAVQLLSPLDSIVLSLPPATTKMTMGLKVYKKSSATKKRKQTAGLVPFKEKKKDFFAYVRDEEFWRKFSSKEEEEGNNTKKRSSGGDGIIEFSPSAGMKDKMRRRRSKLNNREVEFNKANNIGQQVTEVQSSTNILDDAGEAFEMGFISDVLRPLLKGNKILAQDKGIDFKILIPEDNLPGVWFRPRALEEAISNILDNAIKYVTYDNNCPKITVTVGALLEQGGVIVRISDNGPGIPLKEQDMIFERGYRGRKTSSTVSGSGIGLDISRSILMNMGGEVRVGRNNNTSSEEKGSTFEVILYRDARQ